MVVIEFVDEVGSVMAGEKERVLGYVTTDMPL